MIHGLVKNDKNLPLLAYLLECNCDFNVRTLQHRCLPIIIATYNDQVETVRFLVQSGAVVLQKSEDVDGRLSSEALRVAVLHDNAEIVNILLAAAGKPVDVYDRVNGPLLIECVEDHPKYVESLLKAGADPNCCDEDGTPALWYCVSSGDTKLASLLIQYGADVNKEDSDNMSPILIAANDGKMKVLII